MNIKVSDKVITSNFLNKYRYLFYLAFFIFFILFCLHLSNATFVSTGNFSGAGAIYSSVVISNSSLYFGSDDYNIYQLNASNLSQSAIIYSASGKVRMTTLIFNNSIYVGDHAGYFYQLNASNISQQIANYNTFRVGSFDSKLATPSVFNNSIYVGGFNILYQLNASSVSQQIANFTAIIDDSFSSPNITNGFIYIGGTKTYVYQLNISNISQQIANFTYTGIGTPELDSSITVVSPYVYLIDYYGFVYQLNASNVSKQIANYSTGSRNFYGSPTVVNGSVYIGNNNCVFYQLNASNVSQQIANYTTNNTLVENCWTSATISGNNVFVGNENDTFYQLNASNVSQQIANYTTVGRIFSAPTISSNHVYIADNSGRVYQFNASNINQINNIFCQESWSCGNWGDCSSLGTQTRTCTDTNSCGTTISKPVTTQSCMPPEGSFNYSTSNSATAASASTTISSITSGAPFTININPSTIGVNQLIIMANKSISNANFSIAPISHPTRADLQISNNGSVYQAFIISTTGLNDSNIAKVTIRFQVNISWFSENNLDPLSTRLYRNMNITINGISWTLLPTTLISQDSQYYYFVAASPGFSDYSIFAGDLSCNNGKMRCFLNNSQICTSEVWINSKNCQLGCNNGQCITTTSEAISFFQNIFNAVGTFASNNFNIGGAVYYFMIIIITSGIVVAYITLINAIRKRSPQKKRK